MNPAISLGIERCILQPHPWLRSARFGLLMNRASVDRNLRFSCDLLAEAFPGQLVALFSPQHGLWGDAQANMVESDHGWCGRLGVPVFSLYSETRRPAAKMLAGLDLFVIDLQDVGTRVYTFVWTVLECLRACADAGIPVLLLDRPNPIGGRSVEGPLLDHSCRSFVGGASIPMRHGLTLGELARLLKKQLSIDVALEVVPIEGWSAAMYFDDLGRHWLSPSPNLPRTQSTLVYPGQVLLEGTNLSEGRGTTTPFETVGAPFIDPDVLIQQLADTDLPGARLLPIFFRPVFDKWRGELCGGVSLHVIDAERFRPVRTSIALLAAVKRQWPEQFRWLDPPYEYETEKAPIDIIYGSSRLRQRLDSASLDELTELDAADWKRRTADILLYETATDRFGPVANVL